MTGFWPGSDEELAVSCFGCCGGWVGKRLRDWRIEQKRLQDLDSCNADRRLVGAHRDGTARADHRYGRANPGAAVSDVAIVASPLVGDETLGGMATSSWPCSSSSPRHAHRIPWAMPPAATWRSWRGEGSRCISLFRRGSWAARASAQARACGETHWRYRSDD